MYYINATKLESLLEDLANESRMTVVFINISKGLHGRIELEYQSSKVIEQRATGRPVVNLKLGQFRTNPGKELLPRVLPSLSLSDFQDILHHHVPFQNLHVQQLD